MLRFSFPIIWVLTWGAFALVAHLRRKPDYARLFVIGGVVGGVATFLAALLAG